MNIIGYHVGDTSVASSTGEIRTQAPWLDWFLSHSQPDTIQCFYNLDVDVARLLKLINFDSTEGRKLLSNGKLYIAPYTLRYIPKKFFSIDRGFGKGHPFATFSDISQYCSTPIDSRDDKPEGLLTRAGKAAATGVEVYSILTSLGLKPSTLVSPIRVFQKDVLDKLDLPTVDDMPDEVGEFAYYCCKGSWLECFKTGHFDTWDYDLVSSYPFFASVLPDIRQGEWVHTSSGKTLSKVLGFFKGRVTIKANFSPILYKKERGLTYTPRGTWDTYITGKEWAFIDKHKLGHFELEEGWWWEYVPMLGNLEFPLSQTMNWLFSEKQNGIELKREIIKRIMAGIYGKFLEVRQYEKQEMGPLFNPVYAAEIETNTRLEIARFAIDNGITPVHVAVDGLLVDQELPVTGSGAMGMWKLVAHSPALIMGSGAVAVKERKGQGDFALDYDKLTDHINENPASTYYELKKDSPVSLAKALNSGRFEKMGTTEGMTRRVEFCSENKRLYVKKPKCGWDLINNHYESIPLDISILEAL